MKRKWGKFEVIGVLCAAALLCTLIAVVANRVGASQASGVVGTEREQNLGPVKAYMDGKRPQTPDNADRVGVVVKTITKIEPWASSEESLWHAIVYTKADGRMTKIDIWVYDEPREASRRVKVGDYIAVLKPNDPRGSYIYPNSNVAVLEAGAVKDLPNDPQ